MVLIDPPPDWTPSKVVPRAPSGAPIVAVTTDSSGAFSPPPESDASGASKSTPASPKSPAGDASKVVDGSASSSQRGSEAEESSLATPESPPADDAAFDESPSEKFGRKLTLLMIVPAAALLVFTVFWTVSSSSNSGSADSSNAPNDIAEPDVQDAAEELKSDDPLPTAFARRWMPQDTAYTLRCGPSFLISSRTMHVVTESHLSGLWETLAPLLEDLDTDGVTIDALQWAGLTPGRWNKNCVVVLHRADFSNDVGAWFATGEQTDLSVAGVPARQFESYRWPHPMALIDEHTLVTGSPELITNARLGVEESSLAPGLSALFDAESGVQSASETAYRFICDRTSADAAGFTWLPDWIVKQSSATQACQTLRTVPEAVDIRMGEQETPTLSIRLHCHDKADAASVGKAWQQLLTDLDRRWNRDIESLEKNLEKGRLSSEAVDHVRGVLGQALATLQTSATVQEDSSVLVSLPLPSSLNDLAAMVVDSRESRLRFNDLLATDADLSHHKTIVEGLSAAAQSDGNWPMGAAGAAQLRAETRLSWIASMLPYLEGGEEMHRQLNFFRSWNDPANLQLTRRPLDVFTNPRLGPSVTKAGFPTTHYVGVAGLGADAASLDPANPRAGVFNVRHRVSLDDIADGTSQTIAVLGVTGRLGPWAAGGDATVRPLTAEPYINGPDHFGSGMSQGMFASMVDGSVRFIAADIDPHVLEQLVTINGGQIDRQTVERVLAPATLPLDTDNAPESASPMVTNPPSDQPNEPPAIIEYDEDEIAANARTIALLGTRLEAIDFQSVTLNDFMEFMAQLTAAKISFDLDAMTEVGVGTDDTLSVRLDGASYEDILDAALAPLGLGFVIRHGELVVTTLAKQSGLVRVAAYPIADLFDDGPSRETFTAVIQSLVAPTSWTTLGGTGRLLVNDGVLLAETNDHVHRLLSTLLKKLRFARALKDADVVPSGDVSLTSRTSQAFEVLQTPVELNIDQPTPLAEILARLQASAAVNLLLDIPALDAAGITPDVETSLQATGLTLEQALAHLCRSLELTIHIKSARTIQITTSTAADGRLELEFYPIGTQLEAGTTGDALITHIQANIAPQSWSHTGGPAAIHFDQPGNCLIVLQTQRQQVRIEAFLNDQQPQQDQTQ